MRIEMDVDIEKFRWSLVGDGYLYGEAKEMSPQKLVEILKNRIQTKIDVEYYKSIPVIMSVIAMSSEDDFDDD